MSGTPGDTAAGVPDAVVARAKAIATDDLTPIARKFCEQASELDADSRAYYCPTQPDFRLRLEDREVPNA